MGKRSLKASPDGQLKARRAFERTGWTQEQLALEVGLNTRQSVWKFFTGRAIERYIFIDLCFQLNLEWEEIADLPALNEPIANGATLPQQAAASPNSTESSPEAWVETLRKHLQPSIEKQCGLLQSSLDLGRPLALEELYTPIRILPHLRQQQWLDLKDLQPGGAGNFPAETPSASAANQRLQLSQAHPESLDAMEIIRQTPKVLLLGKPGTGKTTFLQYVAQQCITGQYQGDRIPIFMILRHGLSPYSTAPTPEPQPFITHLTNLFQGTGLTGAQLQALLQQGRFLLLLDGLDEVPAEEFNEVLQEIQSFGQNYPDNPFIITSRITSNNPYLPGFFNVEVDNFSRDQIQTFAQQWFAANLPNAETAAAKAKQFLEALDDEENQPLKELMGTPILLSLLCSVFMARSRFPRQRAKLYQAGLDILLQRWDRSRGISRDRTYHNLSMAEKINLLGKIAATTFEKGHYFFEKFELLEIIADYVSTLGDRPAPSNLEDLYQQSDAILQSIQLQHGLIVERAKEIYSFSHLTFQEYLTARKILFQSNPDRFDETIQTLAGRVLETSWHEVLILTANMMAEADPLLETMHDSIRGSLEDDPACQQCLQAIDRKIERLQGAHKPAALRAFYLTLFSDRDLRLATSLDGEIAQTLHPELELDLALSRAFEAGLGLLQTPEVKSMLNLAFALQFDQKFSLEPDFQKAFCDLKQQLPPLDSDPDSLEHWWLAQGSAWLDSLQSLLIEYRQIGHIRTLTPAQRDRLHQYYYLNLFLVNCWKESQTTPMFGKTLREELLRTK